MELDVQTLALLALAALAAGFFDTVAGGGGLITLPALLLAGLPPTAAIGTNKMQASFGTATASVSLLRQGLITKPEVWRPFLRSLAGGAAGAWAIQQVEGEALRLVIPGVLVLVGGYFLFAKNAGERPTKARLTPSRFSNTAVPAIGFYDGFFGPGTGSFFALAGVTLRGFDLVKATALAKTLNFASNIAALSVFILGGKVLWSVGAVMIIGQLVGATLGAHAVVKGGTKLIRPLIVGVSLLMLVRFFTA